MLRTIAVGCLTLLISGCAPSHRYDDILAYQNSQLAAIKEMYNRGQITRQQADALADDVTARAANMAYQRGAAVAIMRQ